MTAGQPKTEVRSPRSKLLRSSSKSLDALAVVPLQLANQDHVFRLSGSNQLDKSNHKPDSVRREVLTASASGRCTAGLAVDSRALSKMMVGELG